MLIHLLTTEIKQALLRTKMSDSSHFVSVKQLLSNCHSYLASMEISNEKEQSTILHAKNLEFFAP